MTTEESADNWVGPPLGCDLPLGRPGLIVHNELVLSGWATSPIGIAGVAVQIEERQWNAGYGLDTPEIVGATAGPNAGRAGYRLRIDTSAWAPGPYYVTVAAFDLEGGRHAIEGSVEIRPFGAPTTSSPADLKELPVGEIAMALDEPRIDEGPCEIEGAVEISGWAYSKEGTEAVLVTLDGRIQNKALSPIVRPDLLSEAAGEIAGGAGFALRLDPAELPPGDHSLSIVALGRNGRAAGFQNILTCRAEPASAEQAADEEPALIDWVEERPVPKASNRVEAERLRPRSRSHAETLMWQDRALLAEADASVSRTEAELARQCQESTLGALREAEGKAAEVESLRGELEAARKETGSIGEQLDVAREELENLTVKLGAQDEELQRRATLLGEFEGSLSWRVTKPLRWIKRKLRRE